MDKRSEMTFLTSCDIINLEIRGVVWNIKVKKNF